MSAAAGRGRGRGAAGPGLGAPGEAAGPRRRVSGTSRSSSRPPGSCGAKRLLPRTSQGPAHSGHPPQLSVPCGYPWWGKFSVQSIRCGAACEVPSAGGARPGVGDDSPSSNEGGWAGNQGPRTGMTLWTPALGNCI